MIEARNFEFLVAGLAAAWLIVIGYMFYLVRRDQKLQQELSRLRDMLSDREVTTLKRRDILKLALSAGALPLAAATSKVSPKIKDIQVIETAPAGLRLTVVKILTDQDGLYGYGDGTFTQRADLIKPAIEHYLKPFLIGKPADRIEDTWQSCYDSSYWKNGPVLNNAISAIDQALWDIKGRQAGVPVYELVGGKTREAVDTYTHASGNEISQTIDQAKNFISQGFRNVRVQVGVPGYAAYGSGAGGAAGAGNQGVLVKGAVFEPIPYMRRAMQLFEACRKDLGDEVQLLHDVHERVSPNQAVQFAKDVEKFHLFYLEDVLSPEDIAYFRQIRSQCATPIAMGELFNSPHEWNPLIAERLIDYIRIHVSQAGGFTPCRKVAILCEAFGVKTAWHGPGDISDRPCAANVTLDLVSTSFGVQEYSPFNERVQEVFHGCPTMKNGYFYINEAPGWGIEIDEKAAAKYPFGNGERGERKDLNGGWGEVRKRDGSIIKQ